MPCGRLKMTKATEQATSTAAFRLWLARVFPGLASIEEPTMEQRLQRSRMLAAWDARGDWERTKDLPKPWGG